MPQCADCPARVHRVLPSLVCQQARSLQTFSLTAVSSGQVSTDLLPHYCVSRPGLYRPSPSLLCQQARSLQTFSLTAVSAGQVSTDLLPHYCVSRPGLYRPSPSLVCQQAILCRPPSLLCQQARSLQTFSLTAVSAGHSL